MMALVIAALVQAQQPSIEDRIAAFLKGDAAARAELVKVGASAIAPLQKAREKAPDKIDALVLEIKTAGAYPKLDKTPPALSVKCDIDMSGAQPQDVLSFLQEISGAALICDRFEKGELKAAEVDLKMAGATVAQVLDNLCRATGLDFGFFHNAIVIGKPERLWGAVKTRPAFGAPAFESQHKTPDDEKLAKQLKSLKFDLDMQNQEITDIIAYVKEFTGIPFQLDGDGKGRMSLRLRESNLLDALGFLTQYHDLDFVVREGQVEIGARDALLKKAAGKK